MTLLRSPEVLALQYCLIFQKVPFRQLWETKWSYSQSLSILLFHSQGNDCLTNPWILDSIVYNAMSRPNISFLSWDWSYFIRFSHSVSVLRPDNFFPGRQNLHYVPVSMEQECVHIFVWRMKILTSLTREYPGQLILILKRVEKYNGQHSFGKDVKPNDLSLVNHNYFFNWIVF